MPPTRFDRGARRIALWGLTTVSTLVLLFSYRTSTSTALPAATTTPTTTTASGTTATKASTSTYTGTVTGSTWGTVSTTVIDSGNCAFAGDVGLVSDSSLVSPAIALGGASGQQISYKQRYALEYGSSTGYDAGVLEIKIGSGSFTDIITAGGSFVQGGYGFNIGSAAVGNPLIGRRAWSGTIGAVTSTVVVNLPASAANQSVQFRWREGCDNSTGSTGWYVDSVQVFSTSYASASIDSDGDRIPDGYELAHGLNPNDPTDAARDTDGDGLTNLQEYIAGTDPAVASSSLQVSAVTRDAATGVTTFSFPSVNGKLYRVEFNNDLANANGWAVLEDNVPGTGAAVPIQDAAAAGQPQRFYRVRVVGQ